MLVRGQLMRVYVNLKRNEHQYAMLVKDEASEALQKSHSKSHVHSTDDATGQTSDTKNNPFAITDNV